MSCKYLRQMEIKKKYYYYIKVIKNYIIKYMSYLLFIIITGNYNNVIQANNIIF